MADDNAKTYGGRWRVVREIGKGGQGVVYEVADMYGLASRRDMALMIQNGLKKVIGSDVYAMHPNIDNFDDLVEAIRMVVAVPNAPRGALKELLPIDEAVNASTSLARMKSELEAMRAVTHPSLIKIIDANIDDRWYVTEYYSDGTLAQKLDTFGKARVLDSLKALRPLVEAVAHLHQAGVVHRDIKPDNVFVADDGHLVLGDCGLAFKMERAERITETFENVGSRDWMPGWAMGMRVADVKPNFDVFSLGKLLWAMISGRARLQLWYHRKPQFNLTEMFPGNESVAFAQTIFDKTVVEEPGDCLPDAKEFLSLVDWTIEALTMKFRIVDGDLIRRCLVCGRGEYRKIVDHDATSQRNFGLEVVGQPKFRIFVCDGCGHTQMFYSMDARRQPVWKS